MNRTRLALLALVLLIPVPGHAKTKDEWITLGARIHGAFGPFIPVGIRIGLDAVDKLKAEPRGLIVTYYNGTKPHGDFTPRRSDNRAKVSCLGSPAYSIAYF
jgi:hypothetical protein